MRGTSGQMKTGRLEWGAKMPLRSVPQGLVFVTNDRNFLYLPRVMISRGPERKNAARQHHKEDGMQRITGLIWARYHHWRTTLWLRRAVRDLSRA